MILSLCWLVFYYILTYVAGFWWLIVQLVVKHKRLKDIPLQTGKVAIVTGGASGIGYYISKGLVAKNVHVFIGCKCREAGASAIKEIRLDFPNAKVDFIYLDLASLQSVKDFAEAFLSRNLNLNILINNAGIMFPEYELTVDGFESQLQVNYLSHFYLTQLLLDKLVQSGSDHNWARIVNVSSHVHFIGNPNLENLTKKINHWSDYSCHKAYADSKLLIVASTYMQDHQIREDRLPLSICATHPGVVHSELWRNVTVWIHRIPLMLISKLFLTAEQGADTTLYAAMSPDLEGDSGGYYDNSQFCDSASLTYDVDFQTRLWSHSIDMIGSANIH